MALEQGRQAMQQQQVVSKEESVELNDFMLRMIEVLNKRFGTMISQINTIDRKVEGFVPREEALLLKKENESLKSRVFLLETEIKAMKEPVSPKVNKNLLKHLE